MHSQATHKPPIEVSINPIPPWDQLEWLTNGINKKGSRWKEVVDSLPKKVLKKMIAIELIEAAITSDNFYRGDFYRKVFY